MCLPASGHSVCSTPKAQHRSNQRSCAQVYEASGDGSLTHPALLKDQITSPAGATIAGLMELENAGVRAAMVRAVRAAARRSEELR